MKHRKPKVGFITLGAMLMVSAMALPGPTAARDTSDAEGSLVDTVRHSLGRFRNIEVAFEEGYVQSLACISSPGRGAMGQHFMKHSLVDGTLDVTQPEMLLYEPMANGKLRLIGVDYLVFYDAWHANHKLPPSLQGQAFFLVRSPNRYGAPTFYTLHVWAFKHNRNGAFAMWNPNVSCENARSDY